MAEMTKEAVVASCKANGGYAAPLLNDQLFLHCKGFLAISNLEEYTAVKVLWLEQNAISKLSGLEQQQELVSLFLQNNTIRSLNSLTTPLRNLRVINLSHNYLASLAGLGAACPQLETLQVSHNRIASLQACEDLFLLADTLTSVDLSFNEIITYEDPTATELVSQGSEKALVSVADDVRVVGLDNDDSARAGDGGSALAWQGQSNQHLPSTTTTSQRDPLVIVKFFRRLPNVSVVYLQGNSISHGLKQYRRNMILHLPQLAYLDERPIFPEERRVVEAWGRGGADAESTERAAILEEKRQHLNSCVRLLTDKMESSRELRNRLTAQWDAKRAAEMEQLNQLRREYRDARAAFEHREEVERDAVEKSEQDARWDCEEAFADAMAPLVATEARHRREYEQAMAVQAATEEAAREIAAAANDAEEDSAHFTPNSDNLVLGTGARPVDKEAILAELLKSDDAILQEMEDEIESVLNSLGPSFCKDKARRASRSSNSLGSWGEGGTPPVSSAANGRAVHTAAGPASTGLRDSRANTHQDVWARFEQWEKRQKSAM